jgi:uncharacterized Zn finger protein
MPIDRMIEKGKKLINSGRVERLTGSHYNVIGNHGTYNVVMNNKGEVRCNCPGFRSRGRCSHSMAVILLTMKRKPARKHREAV